ncbi:MAG: serine/threonine protein phosphatase [Bacteroidales bacterium]|nr:serine/threonine protein phosphatase [Bacteroidales bacterium]
MIVAPLTYKIDTCNAHRYVIGDIHGCGKTFDALISTIGLTTDDQLFILGDMINRGKRSKKVIKQILKLQDAGFQIHAVRGNHEQQFIKYVTEMPPYFYKFYLKSMDMDDFLDNAGNVKEKYLNYLMKLPYYFELDSFFLVHAGFNPKNPLNDTAAMISTRETNVDLRYLNGKTLIHAHTPIDINSIMDMIKFRHQRINLDNGCVLHNKQPEKGNLVCLNIDTYDLHVQKNIDYK